MRLILASDWLHDITDQLLDHDYRSEYPDINNYDVIIAIVTGMVDDIYFDHTDRIDEGRWKAHVRARLHELFRNSFISRHNRNRIGRGLLPDHIHGLSSEISDLPVLPSLYRLLHRQLSGHVVEVAKVEFPPNQVIIINLKYRNSQIRHLPLVIEVNGLKQLIDENLELRRRFKANDVRPAG